MEHFPQVGALSGGTPFDQVEGEGPGCPTETEEGALSRQFGPEKSKRFPHIGEAVGGALRFQALEVGVGADGSLQFDAAFVPEPVIDPESFRDDEDVAEKDSRVQKREAGDRLEGDRGSQIGRSHQGAEGVFLLEGPVLGQVAPGLSHQPRGGAASVFAGERVEKALAGVHEGCGSLGSGG